MNEHRMQIQLNIEQLVVSTVSPPDSQILGEAIQRELTRLLTQHGVPASLTTAVSIGRLDAGEFVASHHDCGKTLGTQVAQSIYEGMSQ